MIYILIGVISDTHIPTRSVKIPEKVFEVFEGVDMILHAGDLECDSVIEELETIAPVVCVRGNCDTNSNLNEAEVIDIEDVKVGLTHGVVYPRGDTQQLYYIAKELGVDVLVSGHTHQPMVEKIGDVILLNPGSPTQPRLTDATVMVVEIDGSDIQADIIKIANAMCRSMDVSQLGLNYKKD